VTGHGVFLVAGQEFRLRLRTGRWPWLLVAWVAVVWLFTALLDSAYGDDNAAAGPGVPLFGNLMLFVLALVLIVSPSFTAQSINGDRERGTLATLQVTRLTAADIAVGKLLAGWAVGVGALLCTVPFVGWAVARGGVGVFRAVVVMAVMAVLMGVICAVSQAWSAVVARSITSAALSYITVFAMAVGTVVVPGLLASGANRVDDDQLWWMLAPNPFVVLADAAPALPPVIGYNGRPQPQPSDPLGEIGRSVRWMRSDRLDANNRSDAPPVWPYGLGFNLLLGAASVLLTIRRLRTPAVAPPRGTRVA
jgi:ABC-type transport system involved in multi-copper enzyme maturation permease subunit